MVADRSLRVELRRRQGLLVEVAFKQARVGSRRLQGIVGRLATWTASLIHHNPEGRSDRRRIIRSCIRLPSYSVPTAALVIPLGRRNQQPPSRT